MKRGLVENPEEWKWSSYRYYALRETGVVEIESEWTARDGNRRRRPGECSYAQVSAQNRGREPGAPGLHEGKAA